MRNKFLTAPIFLILLLFVCRPQSAPAETDNNSVADTASEVAAQLRSGITDVTGNGVGDETDALAQLMHITGKISDMTRLPALLKNSLLGEKYLDKFSYNGIIKDGDCYRSENIGYTVRRVRKTKLVYYVADIYIRNIQHFRTAFPETGYGTTQTVKKMAKANSAVLAINGDYYSAQEPVGVVVRNGVFYSEYVASRRDVCAVFADGTVEITSASETDIDTLYDKQALHVWQFGPELLNDDGSKKTSRKEFNNSLYAANPRTALGYYEPGHYCFVVVEGRGEEKSEGLNLAGLSALMESLGCTKAYNLDGGGSSVMVDYNGVVNTPSSNRKCSDILFIVEDLTTIVDMGED